MRKERENDIAPLREEIAEFKKFNFTLHHTPPLELFCFSQRQKTPLFSQKEGIQNAHTLETVLSDVGVRVRGRIISGMALL